MLEIVIFPHSLSGGGRGVVRNWNRCQGGERGTKNALCRVRTWNKARREKHMRMSESLHDWGNKLIGQFQSRVRHRVGLRGRGLCTIWIRIGEGESGRGYFGR